MSLSGFSVAIADKGGAYRTRAQATLGLTLAGALAAFAGALAGHNAILAITIAALWSGAASLARVLGAGATSVGLSSTIILVVALAAPATSLTAALARAGWVLIGGLWATLVSLVFWPLRPYRPLRYAVAAAYRQLALHAEHVAELGMSTGSSTWPDDTMGAWEAERRTLRQLIEAAREQVVASRRGRPERSERGERMLVLVELADQLFGSTIAASELLSLHGAPEIATEIEPRRSLQLLARAARDMAQALVDERDLSDSLGSDEAVASSDETTADTEAQVIAQRMRAFLRVAMQTVATIEHPGAQRPAAWPEPIVDSGPSARDLLSSTFERSSLTLRHALRVALCVAIAVGLTRVLPLGRGYWLTLTLLIVLQPQTGATLVKVVQRILGTAIGAAITTLIVSILPSPHALLALIIVLIVVCVSLLPVNYFLYSVALTPTFVLLAELSAGDWHLAGLRVENTLLGGALALLGSWLFWPSSEREHYPELQRAALIACRDHLREVSRLWADRSEESARLLATARRRAALATANAEAALDALLGSSAEPDAVFEARMALLTGVRRLVSVDTALSAMRSTPAAASALPDVEALARAAASVLDDLASALVDGRAPQPMSPELARISRAMPSLGLRRISERVTGQLRVLHDVVERMNAPGGTTLGGTTPTSYIALPRSHRPGA